MSNDLTSAGTSRDEYDEGANLAESITIDEYPSPTLIDTAVLDEEKTVEQCDTTPLPLPLRQSPSDEYGEQFAGHLLFGVASTAERLLEARDHLGHWLGGTGARLTIVAPDSHLLPWLKYELERRKVEVVIIISDEPTFLGSYFRLVRWLKETRTSKTQWATFIDDDTFYFSLRRFANMLRKYDEREDYYIGAVSEDGWQMMRSGEFAFGGAGITLSMSLLDRIQPFYERCKTYRQVDPTAPEMGGDLRLARCITRNTPIKLTREIDLHQVDLRGNVRGLIQGPRVPITWHHYRSHMWGSMNVLTFARSVPFCPRASCLFQRFKFYDANGQVSVLHLGHSIARYAHGIDPQTELYEATWTRRPLSTYDHSLEPLRRAYNEGKEVFTYTLEHGQWLTDGSYAQTYIRRADTSNVDEVDDVIEYIWKQ
jgi:hypothetical protein